MLSGGTEGWVSYFYLWTTIFFFISQTRACAGYAILVVMKIWTRGVLRAPPWRTGSVGEVCQADWFSPANGACLCLLLNSWPWKSHKPPIAVTSLAPNRKRRLPGQPKKGGSKSLGGLLCFFFSSSSICPQCWYPAISLSHSAFHTLNVPSFLDYVLTRVFTRAF